MDIQTNQEVEAELSRDGYPSIIARRTNRPMEACPTCGNCDDIITIEATSKERSRSVLHWCPCGAVYVMDKDTVATVYKF